MEAFLTVRASKQVDVLTTLERKVKGFGNHMKSCRNTPLSDGLPDERSND
jgi:hypothetical protein